MNHYEKQLDAMVARHSAHLERERMKAMEAEVARRRVEEENALYLSKLSELANATYVVTDENDQPENGTLRA